MPKRDVLDDLEGEYRGQGSVKLYSRAERPSKKRTPTLIEKTTVEEEMRELDHPSIISTSTRSQVQQLKEAIRKSCDRYFRIQAPEGYWWAELESNVTITAEYIMLLFLLGIHDAKRQESMVRYILNEQTPNGSWALYYGDEGNLSNTVEAYFALKLAGEDPESGPMKKARDYILRNGGIEAVRVFTKIWLALFSQYDWDNIPSMPVELVLLPSDLYFNIYEFSSWARGTVVPLAIIMAIRPRLTLPQDKTIQELYLSGEVSKPSARRFASYTHKLFFLIDRLVKSVEQRHPLPHLRNRAIQEAETWVLDHQEESGDWGGIQPPMVYSILALHYLAYPLDHPAISKGLKALEDFCIEDEQGLRLQSCISPVWDTALTALALLDAGVPPEHPALEKVATWLMQKQVTTGGDWQVKNCCPPGGWSFEFVNTQYPDVDDSAVVLIALERLSSNQHEEMACVKARGIEWCMSMQSSNGGWAAFDKENTMTILNRIPFADNEAMVDYPTEDVTGRVLDAMGTLGYGASHPAARKGLQYLKEVQEPDGCWWGRWGVNYIYGTWSVLRGLISIGEDPKAPYIQAALKWLKDHQNADGGWGETCESYKNKELRGQGPSTASQTAWALMGLILGDEEHTPHVRKGIEYLLETQLADGSWDERYFTGTGFPNHFFIRYHNYRDCFPLMALGQYLNKIEMKDSLDHRSP